jgi:GTP cyclohydrolase I
MKLVKNIEENKKKFEQISDEEAEAAFKTIIKWIGEDPNREGLKETP